MCVNGERSSVVVTLRIELGYTEHLVPAGTRIL